MRSRKQLDLLIFMNESTLIKLFIMSAIILVAVLNIGCKLGTLYFIPTEVSNHGRSAGIGLVIWGIRGISF